MDDVVDKEWAPQQAHASVGGASQGERPLGLQNASFSDIPLFKIYQFGS